MEREGHELHTQAAETQHDGAAAARAALGALLCAREARRGVRLSRANASCSALSASGVHTCARGLEPEHSYP